MATLSSPYVSPPSSSTSSSSSCSRFPFHHNFSPKPHRAPVLCSNAELPLRRPTIPVKDPPPSSSPSPQLPSSPSPSSPPPPSQPSPVIVTVEYQRQRAKEMQEYFLDLKYQEQVSQGRVFGFSKKNEISNGRWAMFGIAVGLLTEYATGSNFVDQMKIIISNLGIADLD